MSKVSAGDCGVCLGGYDGDQADFFDSCMVKARKPHKCYECGETIAKGTLYERVTGKWDGAIDRYCFCAICSDISQSLSCDGRCFGTLWDDIHENLFPTMTTGCLAKLKTMAAKQNLVEKWREWKFSD